MTMTEDQNIAEAERLALKEHDGKTKAFIASFARHYHSLKTAQATQPEQDPALVKAMAVWKDAWAVWVATEAGDDDPDHKAAALVIMEHYHAPSEQLNDWAIGALSTPNSFVGQRDAARYSSQWQERSNERVG